jgi:PAS domain S-box-containing protein
MNLYQEKTSESVNLIYQDLVFMMVEENPSSVIENISAFNKEENIKTGVVGKNGLPAFGTDITVPREIFVAQKDHFLASDSEFIFYKPLPNDTKCHGCHSAEDKTRGMIVIKTSIKKANEEIDKTKKRLLIFAILIGLASELFLIYILRKIILNPLSKLSQGATLLKNGKLDHRIELNRNDEIGALGASFNQMAESIETSHVNLENAVIQKTGELREIAELSTEVFKGDITLRQIIEHCLTTIVDKMGFDYSVFCLVEKETGLLFQEVRKGIDKGLCDMEIPLGSNHPFAIAIREAKAAIKKHADLNIPESFHNLAIIPLLSHQRKRCREINLCGFEHCPAFKNADERCWLINDTLCRSPQSVSGKEKIYGCLHCPAFPVIGVLIAGKKSEISNSALHSLNILTAEIASAVENQRLIEGKKEDIRKMVALNDISVKALQVLGTSISKSIVSYATQFSNTDAAILWLTDEGNKLQKSDSLRIDENLVPEYLPLTENSFVGESLHANRYTETISMEKIKCFHELIQHHGFLYAASIPLKIRDSLLGCITLFKKRDFFMSDSEKAILLLFASQAAAALSTSRIYASLLESEEKFRVLMDDAGDAIFLLNTEEKLIGANKKAIELAGYTREELLEMQFTQLGPLDDQKRTAKFLASALSGGTVNISNEYIQKKDGRLVPVDITSSLIEFKGEKIIQGIVRDITERKQTQEILHAINETFSGKTGNDFFLAMVPYLGEILNMEHTFVGELTEDGLSIRTLAVCAHGKIVANFEYPLAGTPCDNVVGKNLCAYVNGVRKLFPDNHILAEMGTESYIGMPLFNSAGHKPLGIIVAMDSKPISNLKLAEFACQIFSVRTSAELERMRIEKALISAYEFSDAIFNCAASGIMVISKEGRVLKINNIAAEILRLNSYDLIGKKITDIYPEIEDMFLFGIFHRRELTITLPDGTSVPIGFENSPLYHSSEAQEGIVILFRDLTEIKKLQQALRTKEFYATMDMIISGVAHEVRNPLFGITSIGQILERELELPQHKTLTQAMLKEAGRMKRLIDELLLYTRPANLIIQNIDAGVFFEEMQFHVRAKSQNISLALDMPPHITFKADGDKILQVFLNLLNNAIDAAKNNITISARQLHNHVEIKITDDGNGIKKEHLSKAFDPFFTTKKGGTGLGLPICKKIIEDHGGSITIESSEGTGTTVTILLKA